MEWKVGDQQQRENDRTGVVETYEVTEIRYTDTGAAIVTWTKVG